MNSEERNKKQLYWASPQMYNLVKGEDVMRRQNVANKFSVTKEGVEYEFEAVKEGGYVVTVPLYVSCATQGDTFEEALSNIEDAHFECLSAARDLNLPIPGKLEHVLRQTVKS